ncbi:MAG: 3-oxoacyl-ACP reductase FabG [Clostridia bacterium]|nr:3-oxoacyl-ACP reductase FabG [Clostridia bacterium]
MFDLTGKLALVTGSSRGIGKAIAIALAQAGADVIVHCNRGRQAAEDTAEQIRKIGKQAWIEQCDVSSPEEIRAMFDRIQKAFGKLDILVNNAAVLSRCPFLELPLEEWNRIMNTNAGGYFLCSQLAGKMMAKVKSGRIINISSISQYEVGIGRSHYCASKGAIGMLTKCAAAELAPLGITVNAVLPGSIHTDFNSDVLSDPEFYKQCVAGIPAGRIGKAEDIAGAVVMLAADESGYISGACITIDGGKTL